MSVNASTSAETTRIMLGLDKQKIILRFLYYINIFQNTQYPHNNNFYIFIPIYSLRGVFCCLFYSEELMQIYFSEKEHRAFAWLMKSKPGVDHMTAWFTGWMRPAGPAGHTGPDGRTASVNIRSALSRPDAVTREQALKKKPT